MPVESAADRAAFLADFGVSVRWTPAGGSAATLTAIFDYPSTTVAGLSEADIVDRTPTLLCRSADLPDGAAEDDDVSVEGEDGVTHALRCKLLRPDGTGFTIVHLTA